MLVLVIEGGDPFMVLVWLEPNSNLYGSSFIVNLPLTLNSCNFDHYDWVLVVIKSYSWLNPCKFSIFHIPPDHPSYVCIFISKVWQSFPMTWKKWASSLRDLGLFHSIGQPPPTFLTSIPCPRDLNGIALGGCKTTSFIGLGFMVTFLGLEAILWLV